MESNGIMLMTNFMKISHMDQMVKAGTHGQRDYTGIMMVSQVGFFSL
jgi:hypothetical protein